MLQESLSPTGKFRELSGIIETEEELQRVADALDSEPGERFSAYVVRSALPRPQIYLVGQKGISTVIGVGIGSYISIYLLNIDTGGDRTTTSGTDEVV